MSDQHLLPDLGGLAANVCFRAGAPFDPPHITDTSPDTYSLNLLRYHEQPDGSLHYEQREVMRMQGEAGREYLADATEKFNRMLADVGPERAERAACTWGRLHQAHIQDWREVDEAALLGEPSRQQNPPTLDIR